MVIPFNFYTEVACRVSHKFAGNLWHSVEPDSHIHCFLPLTELQVFVVAIRSQRYAGAAFLEGLQHVSIGAQLLQAALA